MAPLAPSTGALGLVTGITTAAVLSGAAVLTVVNAGCGDPGSYEFRGGAVELVGSCVQPDDLPITPQSPDSAPRPLGSINPALAP